MFVHVNTKKTVTAAKTTDHTSVDDNTKTVLTFFHESHFDEPKPGWATAGSTVCQRGVAEQQRMAGVFW